MSTESVETKKYISAIELYDGTGNTIRVEKSQDGNFRIETSDRGLPVQMWLNPAQLTALAVWIRGVSKVGP